MGVYVPEIKMPNNCVDCDLRLVVGCNPYKDNGLAPSKHRHKDCPLIEVNEPHGRLIDAEDLNYDFHKAIEESYRYRRIFIEEDFDDLIKDAPTVIEAEG